MLKSDRTEVIFNTLNKYVILIAIKLAIFYFTK